MNFNEYQLAANKTALYRKTIDDLNYHDLSETLKLSYTTLGLVGEAGEIANKVKKIIRDQNLEVNKTNKSDLKKELGDVLWYAATLATELGYDLEEVAQDNIDKLRSRYDRGVIAGSGDYR